VDEEDDAQRGLPGAHMMTAAVGGLAACVWILVRLWYSPWGLVPGTGPLATRPPVGEAVGGL
jgi:hypothetical protein